MASGEQRLVRKSNTRSIRWCRIITEARSLDIFPLSFSNRLCWFLDVLGLVETFHRERCFQPKPFSVGSISIVCASTNYIHSVIDTPWTDGMRTMLAFIMCCARNCDNSAMRRSNFSYPNYATLLCLLTTSLWLWKNSSSTCAKNLWMAPFLWAYPFSRWLLSDALDVLAISNLSPRPLEWSFIGSF